MCASVFARAKTDTRCPHWKDPRYLRGAYIMNHKKLLLTLTLCLCALLCMVVTASASEVSVHTNHFSCGVADCQNNDHGHTQVTEWTAWNGPAANGNTNITYDSNNTAYIYLADNVTTEYSIKVREGKTLYLCLNGYSITKSSADTDFTDNRSVIDFTEGGSLILCNCKTDGTITHTSGINGRGVWVEGTFIMYGGTISGNDCVCVEGGGVYVDGTFIMYGGTITGNSTQVNGGGGVYADGDKFAMYGGTITNNKAINRVGGGIMASASEMIISGGTIANNMADSHGGGVYIANGTLTLSGNTTITGNTCGADSHGGGVSHYKGAIKISGNVEITGNKSGTTLNNLDLCDINDKRNSPINITNALTGKIGVTTATTTSTYVDIAKVDASLWENVDEKVLNALYCENTAGDTTIRKYTSEKTLRLCKHSPKSSYESDLDQHWKMCRNCDEIAVAKTAHSFAQQSTDLKYKASDATCTTPVTYYYSCLCGATGTNTFNSTKEDEQAKGHAFAAAWEHNDDKHWHKCTRYGCTGIDAEAAHEWQPATTSAPKTCKTCGATTGTKLSAYYYYSPAKTEDTPGSPKAGDPGVLLYAGLALASLTGLACAAKKRH